MEGRKYWTYFGICPLMGQVLKVQLWLLDLERGHPWERDFWLCVCKWIMVGNILCKHLAQTYMIVACEPQALSSLLYFIHDHQPWPDQLGMLDLLMMEQPTLVNPYIGTVFGIWDWFWAGLFGSPGWTPPKRRSLSRTCKYPSCKL